jgi:two-component system nitrogen regulation sensor histidine kinase NtrY
LGLVVLGPALALATFAALGPLEGANNSVALRVVLLADLVYVLVVAAVVLQSVARAVAARRAKSAGSRLHLRLTWVFALIALLPTILVAIFAGLTINVGLEGWFSERVRNVVGNSLAAAQAYEQEHRRDLTADAEALAQFLESAKRQSVFVSDGDLRQLLTQGQGLIQRGLREAYVIDGSAEIRARGERSYLFDFEPPGAERIAAAREGGPVVIEDWGNDEFRALIALDGYPDRLLYVSRTVDGEILNLLDETRETVDLYQQLESDRGRLLFEFGLLYLGFALILILAAIRLGLWFAEGLSVPVGRLALAAQQVGAGDFDTRVREEQGGDEIAMLGRLFNKMTRELKAQREALLENTQQIERRRRLFDSVLSSVTSGVVGLDAEGRVTFANRMATTLAEVRTDAPLTVAVPEFGPLWERLRDGAEVVQDEVRLVRGGKLENLLVRMATRRGEDGSLEGYVVAFDDVTDLVSAQRMAAWGDIARRIAHEIKNPLTPIQLSAQRIQRKFRKAAGDDAPALDQMTEVIVRQTEDLRRIVDEFSRFARMPEPERREVDLAALVSDAVVLQQSGQPEVTIRCDLPDLAVIGELDPTMIGQALTNLIKNAGEATETLREKGAPEGYGPEVRVSLSATEDRAEIRIADNGVGLPEDRARLFEPYVTTRAKGTGLGLPIVRKIITEHGGSLELRDAEPFAPGATRGAEAVVGLPVTRLAALEATKQKMAV